MLTFGKGMGLCGQSQRRPRASTDGLKFSVLIGMVHMFYHFWCVFLCFKPGFFKELSQFISPVTHFSKNSPLGGIAEVAYLK